MHRSLLVISFCFYVMFSCNYPQVTNTVYTTVDTLSPALKGFQFTADIAHPTAKVLLTEAFYWDPTEETAPFGNDDGADASYQFREWRLTNKTTSPVIFLEELIDRWEYDKFDWNELDTVKIKAFLYATTPSSEADIQQQISQLREAYKNLPVSQGKRQFSDTELRKMVEETAADTKGAHLIGQDNAIIGVGFGQLALEGKIDADLLVLTRTAIKRQSLTYMLDGYSEEYRKKREELLAKMLLVLDKI